MAAPGWRPCRWKHRSRGRVYQLPNGPGPAASVPGPTAARRAPSAGGSQLARALGQRHARPDNRRHRAGPQCQLERVNPWRGRGRGRCEHGRFEGVGALRGHPDYRVDEHHQQQCQKTRNQKRPSLTSAAWLIATSWSAVASLTGPVMPGPVPGQTRPRSCGAGRTLRSLTRPRWALTGFRRTLGKVILSRVAAATVRTCGNASLLPSEVALTPWQGLPGTRPRKLPLRAPG
jgi:hypothetical protein